MAILQQNLSSFDPAEAVANVDKYDVTLLGGSPYFVARIADYCVKKGLKLRAKYLIVGGAPVYRHVARNMNQAVHDPQFAIVTYGSTEAEPISFISVKDKLALESPDTLGTCVGRPVVEGSVKVARIGGPTSNVLLEDLDVGVGLPGEIVVSGWHVNTYQVCRIEGVHLFLLDM